MITFTVPAVPVAQPRPKAVTVAGKSRMVSNPKRHPVSAFKATVRLAASQFYDGPPLDGPLQLSVLFVLPRRKGRIWKTKPMPREWHDRKPDFDNLVKSVVDALNGLLWVDDSQIACSHVRKFEASGDERPGVVVQVTQLEPKAKETL